MENKYMSKEEIAKAVDGIAEEAIQEFKEELKNEVKVNRAKKLAIIGILTAAVAGTAFAFYKFKK